MVIDLNHTYKMMMMMTRMVKIQNDHNSANFEATTSIFCMLIDLNNIYGMMMIMIWMIIMMMMLMMIKPKIAITRPILKLQHPDLAW